MTDRTRAMLVDYLDAQRRHVLGILEGLDEPALRRAVLPSGWTCLGLVAHLTYDVERFWFRVVVAGESAELPDDGWAVADGVPADAVFDTYRSEIERANEIIRATALDTPPAWWPEDRWGDWRIDDLHEVLLHVIAETACHAGHLDAARELIDGRTWMVLT